MIAITSIELNAWIVAFMWPFMRIGAMLVAAPVFGARMVPVRVRVALALVLALVMAPMVVQDTVAIAPFSADGLLISMQQLSLIHISEPTRLQ